MPHPTELQKALIAYVFFERQKIEIFKTQAMCLSSLAAADSAFIEAAQEALQQYVQNALRTAATEEKQKDDLIKKLEEETAKAYIITPPDV